MHLFYQPSLSPPTAVDFLSEDDSRHAVKTLRLGIGEIIAVTDGHGNQHTAVITKADARRCTFRITDTKTTSPRPFSVRICVAPTKNLDRIEWFVEKAVEVGIERISFFFGQHSERRVLKLERLEKIAVSAMKQSLQSFLPILDEAIPFSELVKTIQEEQRFIAHLPTDGPPINLAKAATLTGKYAVLIGPEGDFSEKEIQQAVATGFQMVTLGPNRLRTETAALTACQLLNFINV
ncbi:16S rRNA (uracil(1498)-N(3))-methyltransferase [Spirosoma sp. KCTC 42546]|uniref:16S rRNA (uracil(1498)-N(3))-methyltransferase n=1 Tax=Spirosoma sp. KCTC 42546 TaxID=2520506 RepID=UPI00115ADA82|nr:16S rRNA (uracil(1498)-N(3))-methyltransferase [Spirosoma sp. KCTC 42546]QDK79209.1 16S rRNA (uracil(1498)-N(3))-methyltransferase [Spirosoma sp. KCTC 42546]